MRVALGTSPCDNSSVDSPGAPGLGRAFVFASFSNFQKLDPGLFRVWCAILTRVQNSVLWLLRHDGAEVRRELQRR